ncbi:MAG: TRAP transporter substrate-binding protein [Rhodothalassiaceae bacterium]
MRLVRLACVFVILGLVAACGPSQEEAGNADAAVTDKPVRWRLASTYPSSIVILGSMGKRIETLARAVSGGRIELRFHEPGALIPPFEIFDAVSYGAIEAGWSTPGYWAGREPALQLFAAVPFGPSAAEYLAWFDYGGGREIFEDIYHRHNIHSLICGISPPEAAGWFKKPIETVDDFRGLRVRYFGLGGKVLEKLGASVQLLSGGEIFQALELGAIDGSEYSVPAVDLRMGFYQAAKHYYFPGWHQQSTFFELMINLDAWKSLSAMQQAQIEAVCSENIRYGLSEGEALQIDAMRALEEKGVVFHRFPPEVLAALRKAWGEVATELSAENADFRRGWESLRAFREAHAVWRERGYLRE